MAKNNKIVTSTKRPLWERLVLYLIIIVIVALLGFNFFGNKSATKKTTIKPTSTVAMVTTAKNNSIKGTYLTDLKGMTLYTFDNDTIGVSNCTGKCAGIWPPYTASVSAGMILPTNISIIVRPDETKQFAWKNMPLYTFIRDAKPGDVTGDNVEGFHIVKL